MQQQLAESTGQDWDGASYASGEVVHSLHFEGTRKAAGREDEEFNIRLNLTWDQIFYGLGEDLLIGTSFQGLRDKIQKLAVSHLPDEDEVNLHVSNEMLDPIINQLFACLLYTSPSPRDQRGSRMPSSA